MYLTIKILQEKIRRTNNNKMMIQSNNNKILNCLQLSIFAALLLLVQLVHPTIGYLDWMQKCDPCHCQWNSGKKTADCKNKLITTVPQTLNNLLQVIDLSHNKIPTLKRDEFTDANLNNLHKIFMRNCTLHKIDRNALNGLSILIELDFSHNYINELHADTFHGLSKLRNLVMNNNEIEILPNFLFAGLNFLSRVEFTNNRLKIVEINVFSELPMLSAVYLESNQLTMLHREVFAETPKLLYLSLALNPWNCTCELKDFRDYTINNRLYTPPTACSTPSHLSGKQWNEIPSENFACQPRITSPLLSFTEAHSNNVTLFCKIISSPKANVTWLFNKRPVNTNDFRMKILESPKMSQNYYKSTNEMVSLLIISDLRLSDMGVYTCIAENRAGRAEAEFQLYVNKDDGFIQMQDKTISSTVSSSYTNIWFIICLVATVLLFLLILAVLLIFLYCRRIKAYQKNTKITNDDLIKSKSNKTECSILEGGSVIREMQKSLLNEVNPVEKPPRRTELDNINGENEESHDMQKSLLDEKSFIYCRSMPDENASVSNAQFMQPRRTFIENSLPPDLLAFPAHRPPTSPSIKSSLSNLPEHVIYGVSSSPLTSPVLAQMSGHAIYDTAQPIGSGTPTGYMTLQHPKSRNMNMMVPNSERKLRQQKQQSPFMPAPVLYSPTSALIIKQGYMTIPRKPRVPSWAISNSKGNSMQNKSNMSGSPNPSENSVAGNSSNYLMEPVYDNLGVRTTAGGNSTLNLNKTNPLSDTMVHYTMRHRPLPATPSLTTMACKNEIMNEKLENQQLPNEAVSLPTYATSQGTTKIYEPIEEHQHQQQQHQQQHQQQQQQQQQNYASDMLYSSNENNSIISNNGEVLYKISKIPPRPPPKPKKKQLASTIKAPGSNTSQIFDDEGEDGTEV